MKDWIWHQFVDFNFITILVMITFVTAMSKANMNKQLKKQSEELYNEFEEIKDEIREHHANITALIMSSQGGKKS